MSAPWLSVVLPTFDGTRWLETALRSVAAQGALDGVELIAVDDGSRDATPELLARWRSELPLQVVLRRHSGNWVASTNHGLSLARGRHACFLHQDDAWLPGRLAALRSAVAEAPDAPLIVHPSVFIDERDRPLGTWRCPLPRSRAPLAGRLVFERLLVQNFLAIPAPVFQRAAALAAGGLDEALWYTADWDLWLKLARAGPVLHLPQPLTAFRLHGRSQTFVRSAQEGALAAQLEAVLRRHLPALGTSAEAREIEAAARFSARANASLAGALHGKASGWAALGAELIALRPSGLRRYWRDSRVGERVLSRLRLAAREYAGRAVRR